MCTSVLVMFAVDCGDNFQLALVFVVRVVLADVMSDIQARFPLPELTARVDG